MSNLEPDPRETECGGAVATRPERTFELIEGRDVPLGRYTIVRRMLPDRSRRMVGAWCFLDHFGPEEVAGRPGMRIPPHPHTGLQTVTWLLEGEILHRDSLGSVQRIHPGELNLMTAGRGIAHSEESPAEKPPRLHGLQLWVALPDRPIQPRFEHHAVLPRLRDRGAEITVVVGELAGQRSPAQVHTPLVGAELALGAGATLDMPLETGFEHAIVAMTGSATVDGHAIPPGSLLYLGSGRSSISVAGSASAGSSPDTRLFLLGGEPFAEELVMWWNFVGRSHEEIVAAREDWAAGRRFGTVHGFDGDPLPAPPLPTTRLRPRPNTPR